MYLGSKFTKEEAILKFKSEKKIKFKREVAQSCPTLCDPVDCSLPCSSVHGIFQARVLFKAIINSRETSKKVWLDRVETVFEVM